MTQDVTLLLPASITHNHATDGSLFQVSVSTSHMKPITAHSNPGHVIGGDSSGKIQPHPFYREILQWNSNEITASYSAIAHAIECSDLYICADGAYIKSVSQASQAWVFSDGKQNILWKGAGPTPGLNSLMTPYRAELAGLISVLIIIHWICQQALIAGGLIMIYCDNETALSESFKKKLPTKSL
jgi:hypothetical protein